MNTFTSTPSNGLINSAHISVAYSQRLTPAQTCQNVFAPTGRDAYGEMSGVWATVCARPVPNPTPERIIMNASADVHYPPGGPFPKTT
jgi:hypothetical protein